jgi:ribosome maturation factor RimP
VKHPEHALPHQVLELLKKTAEILGHGLYHAELRGKTLRVLIEGKTGNSLDACAEFSRHVSSALDSLNVPWGRYYLEVSSPGIEKPLYDPEHFIASVGREVHIVTKDGGLDGILASAGKTSIVLETCGEDPADRTRIDYTRIKSAHIKVSSAELFGGVRTGLKDE